MSARVAKYLKEKTILLIKEIAAEKGGITSCRPEADNYADYSISPDGALECDGYASGDKLEDLSFFELAWIVENNDAWVMKDA